MTLPTSVASANSSGGVPTALLGSQATSRYAAPGQSTAASSAAAFASLSAAALSQEVAAASSEALAGASDSSNSGSEVGILAQVIIAIGVLPIEVIIVTIVVGIYRLVHRRSSRPIPLRAATTSPRRDSLPFVRPKAELEDEQRRRYELHGQHLVHELDGGVEIFQMPDGTDDLILPLQGRQEVQEMPERRSASWEMPLQGRWEIMGDEYSQELESSV